MTWKLYFLFLMLAGCASSQKASDNLFARKAEATSIEDIGKAVLSECKSKPTNTADEETISLSERSRLVKAQGQSIVSPYEVIRLPTSLKEFFILSSTGIETTSTQWNAVFPEVYEVQGNSTLQPLLVTYGFIDSGLRRQLISKVKISQTDSACLLVTSKIQNSQKPVAVYSFGAGLARSGVELNSGGPRKAIYAYPFGELIFSSKVNGSAQWEKTR